MLGGEKTGGEMAENLPAETFIIFCEPVQPAARKCRNPNFRDRLSRGRQIWTLRKSYDVARKKEVEHIPPAVRHVAAQPSCAPGKTIHIIGRFVLTEDCFAS